MIDSPSFQRLMAPLPNGVHVFRHDFVVFSAHQEDGSLVDMLGQITDIYSVKHSAVISIFVLPVLVCVPHTYSSQTLGSTFPIPLLCQCSCVPH